MVMIRWLEQRILVFMASSSVCRSAFVLFTSAELSNLERNYLNQAMGALYYARRLRRRRLGRCDYPRAEFSR
ncbi:hypothetical protein EDC01DRAFT_649210 [Geopyxis carbonaria]|nr:hypothetical protein EDC01DRAFT_649210 [Geopyxis carbonaria]